MAINLAPEEEKEKKNTEGRYYLRAVIRLGLITFILTMIILGIEYGFNYYINYDLNKKITNVREEKAPLKEYADSYQKYIQHPAKSVLQNHLYFSQLIEYLDNSVTPNIVINNISYNSESSAMIQGFSNGGMKAFSVFVTNLDKRGFSNVTPTSVGVTQGDQVSFSIIFNFDVMKLKK